MSDSPVSSAEESTKSPRVEVLYFAGCPSYEQTRELVEVEDADRTVELRFLGSPTVRVDGHDVEPRADERKDFAFACRVYRTQDGVAETPDPRWIRVALDAAAS